MIIGKLNIGNKYEPVIIAEMSGNHNQSLGRAIAIVEAAAESGAHAIKLQTYTPDTITLDINSRDFFINDKNSIWNGQTLYDLYKQAYTPWEWHSEIMQRANELGMTCFSSPFDESAVDFLEELHVPAYKIASFENTHLPLIRKVASTGKPIIISTGMASISEIDNAVTTARNAGCNELILLKCTSTYPAAPENSNILTIPHMQKLFNCEVGASIAAIAHGATIIEKHFTLSRDDGGVDSTFSLEPDELKSLVVESKTAWQSLGKISYGESFTEKQSKNFRRSIYVSRDLKKGDTFTKDNLKIIRPGVGMEPKYFELVLGKRIKSDIKKGTPLRWEMILN